MGRWAQARRRGGRRAGGVELPAPPAPAMEAAIDGLIVSRTGLPDPVGEFSMFWSLDGDPPWTLLSTKPNLEPTVWAPGELVEGRSYRATEIGGPPNYSGESAPCAAQVWTGA